LRGNLLINFLSENYKDESRERLIEFIQDNIAGQSIRAIHQPMKTNVLELMSTLQASLYETKIPIEKKERRTARKTTIRRLPSKILHLDRAKFRPPRAVFCVYKN
jgi:non-homologous end joining protein Ku